MTDLEKTTHTVAHNIKALRERFALTQADLAERIAATRSAIGSYEEQRAVLPIQLGISICDTFGISLDDLYREKLWETSGNKRGQKHRHFTPEGVMKVIATALGVDFNQTMAGNG